MEKKRRRLYENSLIIAPASRQRELLSYRSDFPDASFKLMSKEAFLRRGDYQYDSRAEIHLIKKGFSYAISKDILSAFARYTKGKNYQSEKLNTLMPLFEELLDLHYLFRDFDPDGDLKGRHIVISGYSDGILIGRSMEHISNLDTSFDILQRKDSYPDVTVCRDLVDECHFVAHKIASMIESGISPNDIYLANYSAEYQFTLSLFSSYYGFSINFPSPSSIFASPLGREFLNLLHNVSSEEALEQLHNLGFAGNEYESFADLARTYDIPELSKERQIAIYAEIFKQKTPTSDTFDPAVNILSGYYAPQGSHVLFLDFSLGNTPKTAQKPAYFSENELSELGFPSLEMLNACEKNELLALLRQKEVESISFHQRNFTEDVYESPLISDLGLKKIKPTTPEKEYSEAYAALFGRGLRDKVKKYGTESLSDKEDLFRYPVSDIPLYSNAFLYDDPNAFAIPKSYSFSGIDSYFKCPFSFYVSRVLKLPSEPSSFSVRLGTIFHQVLKERFDPNTKSFDLDQSWSQAIQDSEEDPDEGAPFSATEKALLANLKDDLAKVIAYIETKEGGIKGIERKVEYPIKSTIGGVSFYGEVDKAILYGESHRYYLVIDYKTYVKGFDEKWLPYGINMQLPLYSLLLDSDDDFKDATLGGVFFSMVSLSAANRATTDLDQYGRALRLSGLFLNDPESLSALGIYGNADDYLLGTKLNKDGTFATTDKSKSADDFKRITDIATDNVVLAKSDIDNRKFAVSPAKWDNNENACSMCGLRAYCFRQNKDYRDLNGFAGKGEEEDV